MINIFKGNIVKIIALFPLFSPLMMNPFGHDVYELPKVVFFLLCICFSIIYFVFYFIKVEKFNFYYNKYLILFVILSIFSLLISSIFGLASMRSFFGDYGRYQGLITQIMYLIYFVFLINFLNSEKNKESVLKIILFVSLIIAVYAIAQFFGVGLFFSSGEIYQYGFFGKSFSTLGHPNFLGQILLIPIWISIYYFLKSKNKLRYLIIFLILFTALLLSKNRASWLGIMLSLLSFIVMSINISKVKKIILSLFSIGIFSTGIIFLAPTLRSLSSRMYIWDAAINSIKNSPIFGTGIENFTIIYQKYISPGVYDFEPFYSIADRAHNEFLDVLVNQGLLGFFVFLIPTILVILNWKKVKGNKYLQTLIGAFIAVNVSNFFSFNLTANYIFYFTLLALIFREIFNFKSIKIKFSSTLFLFLIIFLISFFTIGTYSLRAIYADSLFLLGQSNSSYLIKAGNVYSYQDKINYQIANNLAFNDMNEAYDYLEKGGKFSNYDFIYYLNLAWVEKEFGNVDKSIDAYNMAESLAPNYPQILIYKGKYLFETEKYDEAIVTFEKLLDIVPNYWEYTDEEIRKDLINYSVFVSNAPDFEGVLYYLEAAYRETGNSKKAMFYEDLINKKRGY